MKHVYYQSFECKLCDYSTQNKKDYGKHLQTKKHLLRSGTIQPGTSTPAQSIIFNCNGAGTVVINGIQIPPSTTNTHTTPSYNGLFVCECGKKYMDRTGIWKHKKKCAVYIQMHEHSSSSTESTSSDTVHDYSSYEDDIKDMDTCNQDHDHAADSKHIGHPNHTSSNCAPPIHTRTSETKPPVSHHPHSSHTSHTSQKQPPISGNDATATATATAVDDPDTNSKVSVKDLTPEIITDMLRIIREQHELLKELIPKVGNNITNNTNNTQFNLNFFLNEECKDAINLSDFVNSLEISMDDLDVTKSQGLVSSISTVLVNGLKQLDVYKRPIHCTDQKRDTIYIKDNHKWQRDEGNIRIKKVFVDIANKEYKAIKTWMDTNPGWENNTRLQDIHHKMLLNVLHEIKDDPVGERKILKCLEQAVFIEK